MNSYSTLITAISINFGLISLVYRVPLLTKSGWINAAVLGTILWTFLSWNGWLTVVLYFLLGSIVTKIGLKTYFLTIQFSDKSFNENFEKEFDNLKIKDDFEILTMCMGGVRSQAAAEFIKKKNYKSSNISDGFLGNNKNIGWKANNLPVK